MLTADARSRGRAAFLPSVTVPIALLVASVQPARAQLIGEPSTAETPEKAAVPRLEVPSPSTQRDANGVIDMSTLDPHDFRALAVRLPEGVAPRVDGRLDDDAWQRAPAFGDFTQRDPDVGAPSTHRTEFRIVYDDARIYIAIWAFEPHEGGVIASELERDSSLRKGDAVRVTVDTFHDHRNLFYFSTNPLAAMKDAFSSDNGNMLNFDWDSVWEVQTSVDDEGWYSEFAIPLSQLRFRDRPDQVWGVNVMRIVMHIREESSFVPLPVNGGRGRAAGQRAAAYYWAWTSSSPAVDSNSYRSSRRSRARSRSRGTDTDRLEKRGRRGFQDRPEPDHQRRSDLQHRLRPGRG